MDELEDCMNQVYRMALASMQSFTFWMHTDVENVMHEEVIKEFGNFFYATHEAHLTMMIISLDCLYDAKPKLLNFTKLLTLLPSTLPTAQRERIEMDFEALVKQFKGIKIVRNNSFGHVASYETRMAIGEKHGPTTGELMELCYGTLVLATNIARLLGRELPSAQDCSSIALETIEALYARLESVRHQAGDASPKAD